MRHIEDGIQKAVVEHLNLRGVPGLVFWHTPNGGRRNIREAARFKKMGVRPGVSDLILYHRHTVYCLEIKAPKGRVTDEQKAFMRAMCEQGARAFTAFGLDQSLACLEMWKLLRGKTA